MSSRFQRDNGDVVMKVYHFIRKTLPPGINFSVAHVMAHTSEEAHVKLLENSYSKCPPAEWIATLSTACSICKSTEE